MRRATPQSSFSEKGYREHSGGREADWKKDLELARSLWVT